MGRSDGGGAKELWMKVFLRSTVAADKLVD